MLTADLATPDGADLVRSLAQDADVVLEGFRPGVVERLGVGPAQCQALNPALVYGRMTGWGQSGPLSARAGHDINYVGLTGALHAVGRAGQPPSVPLFLVGDLGGGSMFLLAGVLAALDRAHRTGSGDVVDAAIVDGVAMLMAPVYAYDAAGEWSDERGTNALDSGRPPRDLLHGLGNGAATSGSALREFGRRSAARSDRRGCRPALSMAEHTPAQAAFDRLVNNVLVVEPDGDDQFIGLRPPESFDRVYGGEIAGQGLVCAAATVDRQRSVDSLHVAFLRIGDPTESVAYGVQRLRDSTQFSTRLVTATQRGRPIATLIASFQLPRAGVEHAVAPKDLGPLPQPDALPRRSDRLAAAFGGALAANANVPWPIDIRYVDHEPWAPGQVSGIDAASNRLWLRADGTMDTDPLKHASVLAYASDLTMFEPVIGPHGGPPHHLAWDRLQRGAVRGASLDHSIWFHRPFRSYQWLLHEQDSPVAHGSRGFATGRFFTMDGVLVASVAQEVALLV